MKNNLYGEGLGELKLSIASIYPHYIPDKTERHPPNWIIQLGEMERNLTPTNY
jgi:hypothetical protein